MHRAMKHSKSGNASPADGTRGIDIGRILQKGFVFAAANRKSMGWSRMLKK